MRFRQQGICLFFFCLIIIAPFTGRCEIDSLVPLIEAGGLSLSGPEISPREEATTELEYGLREVYSRIAALYEHGSLDPSLLESFIDFCRKLSPHVVTDNCLLFSLATIHFRRGDWDAALSYYEQSTEAIHELRPFLLWRKSQCLTSLGRHAESLVLLGQLIDDGPPRVLRNDIHKAYARTCITLDIAERKDPRLKRILSLHRHDDVYVETELERVRQLLTTDNQDQSQMILFELMTTKRINRLSIEMAALLNRLELHVGRDAVYNSDERTRTAASFFMRIGEFTMAESLLRSHREKYPHSTYSLEVQRSWCDSLYRTQRYDEAIAAYEKVLEQTKHLNDKNWVRRRIARCFQLKGDYQQAILRYDEVISQSPRSGDARLATFSAAFCEEMLKQWNKARRRYEGLTQSQTRTIDREEAFFRLAMLEHLQGNDEKALEAVMALRKERKITHREEDSLFWLGKLQLLTSDAKAAQTTLNTFLEQYPVSVYRSLVETWLTNDDRLSAARHIEVDGNANEETDMGESDNPDRTEISIGPMSEIEDPLARLINGKPYPPPQLFLRQNTPVSVSTNDDSSVPVLADRLRFHFDYELALLLYRDYQRRNWKDIPLMLTMIDLYLLIDQPYDALYIADALRGLLGGTIDWSRIPLTIKRYFFPFPWKNIIEREAKRSEIEPALLAALIRQESRYKQTAVSSAGARGLMQIMPETGRQLAQQLGTDDYQPEMLFNKELNIIFGTWYLSELMRHFENSVPEALAGYNAGRKNISSWMSIRNAGDGPIDISDIIAAVRFRETRNYIKLILINLENYRQLAN